MKAIIAALIVMSGTIGSLAHAENGNGPVTVIAIAKVKPEYQQAFRTAAAAVLQPTRMESGNISYQFNQSTQDPTEFSTAELWVSQQDIDKHMTLPHMQKFFQAVGNMFETGYPIIKTYQKFER